MRRRATAFTLVTLSMLAAFVAPATAAPSGPANFSIDDAVPGAGFVVPTGIAFLPDGRLLVCEKRGRVYEVRKGVRRAAPLWSAENEVLDIGDRGLLGVAVDPNYFANHFIYLLYTVDPDSNGIDDNDDAFGRLTRYQVNFTDSNAVIASSRTILMGAHLARRAGVGVDSHTHRDLCAGAGRQPARLDRRRRPATTDTDAGGRDAGRVRRRAHRSQRGHRRVPRAVHHEPGGKILRSIPRPGTATEQSRSGTATSARCARGCGPTALRNPFRFTVRPGTGKRRSRRRQPRHALHRRRGLEHLGGD